MHCLISAVADTCNTGHQHLVALMCSARFADVAPIVLRLMKGKDLTPGTFSMGWAQPWVNAGAVAFILFSVASPLSPPLSGPHCGTASNPRSLLSSLTRPLPFPRATG